MPQITYLLVQEQTTTSYKIHSCETSKDIPNTSNVQVLLDDAVAPVCDLMDIDSAQGLVHPVADFLGQPLGDIKRELGEINKDFLENKAVAYSANKALSLLKVDGDQGSVLVLFKMRVKPVHRLSEPDVIAEWNKRAKIEIPQLDKLLGFIEQPLTDEEKIQTPPRIFHRLITSHLPNVCTEEDVQSLFRLGDGAENPNAMPMVSAALKSPPPRGRTETAFISFWDANIRSVLEIMIPRGTSIRNSNQHTETRIGPDYGFLISHKCLFRGEEKVPGVSEETKAELAKKLKWVYSPAPYVLGYYCIGSYMTLVAITPPVGQSGTSRLPVVHDLVKVDLSLTKGRIDNIRHLINLAALLKPLADIISSVGSEYKPMQRTHCTVEITGSLIVKVYKSESRVQRLRSIHRTLQDKEVPNVDRLLFARGNTVHLGPRGIATQPGVESELRQCLKCVLEALIVTHQIPLYHRDIQWSNIVRLLEDQSKWLIIDWEDAVSPPASAEEDFTPENHSPAIRHDGYGGEVDIWGVGHLITTCMAADISMDLRQVGWWICEESERLSAQEVLHLINRTT